MDVHQETVRYSFIGDHPKKPVPKSSKLHCRCWRSGGGGACCQQTAHGSVALPNRSSAGTKLDYTKSSYSTSEKQTPFNDITHYNNYYEFSTDKYEPADLAKNFNPRPWTIKVEGLVNKPKTFDIDTLLKTHLEERIYRMRCVEGWSMVIPWIGFPLSTVLNQVEPNSKAKFVAFTLALRPQPISRAAAQRARLALRRGPAHGRSHASADDSGRRSVRRDAAQPGRRARSGWWFRGSTASRESRPS